MYQKSHKLDVLDGVIQKWKRAFFETVYSYHMNQFFMSAVSSFWFQNALIYYRLRFKEVGWTPSDHMDEDSPKSHNFTLTEAVNMAQNRPLWRLLDAVVQYILLAVQARNDDDDDERSIFHIFTSYNPLNSKH